ncbi:3'-5' exoribonuclease YhaM [Sporolactobacillus shoreicorticis]|uniref:3'-5' exoribonuclease YhaM n=1 Tax=Sporolactobacillus shoreicorticis TaxID=1923877 RepID=A0ABW5RXQ7_9BACL|nr:3'-5' exoribonuclease YhaM [Sporolactobacillus shoreicorticis]MCO7124946.1 3'-5' exoribonuclease YhaM [Sporolactobacillus shoreicorticis]
MVKGIAFYKEGEHVHEFLLIKSVTKGLASNGKPFLTIYLQDKTGDIESKLWGSTAEDEANYVAGAVVLAEGDITTFRGRNQFKIRTIRPTTEHDQVNKAELVMSAPLSIDELNDKITQYLFEIKNPVIQRLTRALLKKHHHDFFEYPAAVSIHHNFLSGLAYHVCCMLDMAKAVVNLYPEIDKDLLYAGIIIHDMGKLKELSGVTATSYTLQGNLLGHISIMVAAIGETADELGIGDKEEVLLLKHMVLSHHENPEWGSPKPPMFKEAEILHILDDMDAKINVMTRAIRKTHPGEFSERIFAMNNRTLYRPSFDIGDAEDERQHPFQENN